MVWHMFIAKKFSSAAFLIDKVTVLQFLANVITFAICYRLSVCRLLSVMFVYPTQVIEIFRNVSSPFGTLAICDLSIKILWRLFQGNSSVGGLNRRGVAKYSNFGPFQGYISNMVPKSVTLNDLERRKSCNLCIISRNSVAFRTDYVKVVENTLILSAAEM